MAEDKQAPAPSNGTVRLQAPDGQYGTANREDVADLLKEGYRQPTTQELAAHDFAKEEGAWGTAKVFAGKAVSEALFGIPEALLDKTLTEQEKANKAALIEENPVADVAGSVLGSAASLAIPIGGEMNLGRAAAKGGAKIAEGVANKYARSAVAGMAETVIGSAPRAVIPTLIDPETHPPQQIGEDLALAAGLGFIAGGALPAFEAATKKTAELTRRGVEWANERAKGVEQIITEHMRGIEPSILKDMRDMATDDVVKFIRKHELIKSKADVGSLEDRFDVRGADELLDDLSSQTRDAQESVHILKDFPDQQRGIAAQIRAKDAEYDTAVKARDLLAFMEDQSLFNLDVQNKNDTPLLKRAWNAYQADNEGLAEKIGNKLNLAGLMGLATGHTGLGLASMAADVALPAGKLVGRQGIDYVSQLVAAKANVINAHLDDLAKASFQSFSGRASAVIPSLSDTIHELTYGHAKDVEGLREAADDYSTDRRAQVESAKDYDTYALGTEAAWRESIERNRNYVLNELPKQEAAPFFWQYNKKQVLDPTTEANLARKLALVHNPNLVVDLLKSGQLTPADVSVVQQAWPGHYNRLQKAMFDKISDPEISSSDQTWLEQNYPYVQLFMTGQLPPSTYVTSPLNQSTQPTAEGNAKLSGRIRQKAMPSLGGPEQ